MPYLDIITHDGKSARRELNDKPLTIGRHPDNVLPIADDLASRFHCVVEKIPSGFRVRDLKSRNGTKLNGEKVEAAPLKPGDVLAIGKTQFRFVESVATAAAKPAAPATSGSKPAASKPTAKLTAKPAPPPPASQPIELSALQEAADAENEPGEPVSEESIQSLQSLARSGEGAEYTEDDLALINARGETVHAAARGAQSETTEGTRVLRLLLLSCLRTRATDLHVEPKQNDYIIRLRIDGTMVEAMRLDRKTAARIVGVVKVLCDIDISQRSIIQEGHFSSQVPGRRIDYRISFTPSMHGQKLVIRVLDLANAPRYLTELQMPDWMINQIKRVSKQDAGMVLVSGPTGSGKTTTLYTVLRDIDVQERNVVTIEDPVEYQIDGVTQIPVDAQHGNDFATLLRSILRQDPDVILLGEVRDKETALTAMQAAMTGHLVLSTIHAKDSVGSIFRLLDLGVEPYLVASALNLVIAQRLVKTLCPHCKIEKKPTPQQQMKMGRSVDGLHKIFIPAGCPKCFNSGYSGRRGLYELLQVSDDIRDVILKNPTLSAIKQSLEMTVFTTLQQGGYKLVAEGVASFDEIERVTGMD